MKTKIFVIAVTLSLLLSLMMVAVKVEVAEEVEGSVKEEVELKSSDGPPWPTYGQNNRRTGQSPYYTSHVDGSEKWRFDLSSDDVSSPVICEEGTIYLGSGNNLYAIDPDGTEKWTHETNVRIRSSPTLAEDGTIYFSAGRNISAVNPEGEEKWTFDVGMGSSPTIAEDGTIIVHTSRHIHAINPDGTEKWSWHVGASVRSLPTIGEDGTIYVGISPLFPADYHQLLALNRNGTEKWRFSTEGNVLHPPAVGEDGTIYMGSRAQLYAINPDGTEKWNSTEVGVRSSPAIGSCGTIYVGSGRSLHALHSEHTEGQPGTEKWNTTIGDSQISTITIGGEGTIYISSGGSLHAVHSERTEEQPGMDKWKFYLAGSSPAIGEDGTIYLVSENNLYALGGEDEVDKTVVEDWETASRELFYKEGRKSFTQEITFEETDEITIDIRHENDIIDEHVVQVEKEGDTIQKIEESDDIYTSKEKRGIQVVGFHAPEKGVVGETATIEVKLENSIEDSQNVSLYIDDKLERKVLVPRTGTITRYEHTFTYDMEEEMVPRDISFEFSGNSDLYRLKEIMVKRPDSDELEGRSGFEHDGRLGLSHHLFDDGKIGEFEETIPTIITSTVRENIYSPIRSYLRAEYGHGNFTDPGVEDINPAEMIFGEALEDWLEDPDPLRGEYKFVIELHGIDLEMEEGRVTFLGVSEDEEETIDRNRMISILTPTLILLGVVIVIAWAKYRKKKS